LSYILTAFSSNKTSGKVPYSPYDDGTFVFETFNFNKNIEFFGVMVSHFILNLPLNIQKPIRTQRRSDTLGVYFQEKLSFIILDIDKVKSEFNKNKIIDYFKDYKCILGESRSYNGIDNFNLKGAIFIETMELNTAKTTLLSLKKDIENYGDLDESVLRKAAFNAPILKNNIFLNNENGIILKPIIKKISEFFDREVTSNFDFNNISQYGEAKSIEELCLRIFNSLGFVANKTNVNSSLSFAHPSEQKTKGGFYWFPNSPFIMHHPNTMRSVDIFNTVKSSPEGKAFFQKKIDYQNELKCPDLYPYNNIYTFNEQILEVENKKKIISEFLYKKNGLLSIKSPMGSGKSFLITEIIEQAFQEDKKVVIITNRISVAEDFSLKYKKFDLKLYNKDKFNIGDSLIVQFDSLYRYSLKYFDVVIIDEFVSLMVHARNNLTDTNANILKLFATFNKKFVIADAFLTGYEQQILQKTENTVLIDNTYRDEIELKVYEHKSFFIQNILQCSRSLKSNEKLSISCTSLGMIKGLKKVLEKNGLDVITLTSETPDISKKLIYDLFSKREHDKFNVVIYSPTLTVGVSNLNNVKHHFHYDSGNSCDVVSSIQMIKRTRYSNTIHLYLKPGHKILKTSFESLKDYYMNSINRKSADSYIFEIDNYGDLKLSNAGKHSLKIDTFTNIMESNHREAFLHLLKEQFKNEPIIIENTGEAVIDTLIREIQKETKEINLSYIEEYFKLSGNEKEAIILSKYKNEKENVFKKMIELEEQIEVPFGMKEEILEEFVNDNNFLLKLKRYQLFSKNYSEDDLRRIQAKNIAFNKQEELVYLNNLIEFSKKDNKLIKSFYTPRELLGENNKLLLNILKVIGFKKDKSGVLRFPDRISKFAKYIKD
jgi:hypothetical protein